MAAFDDAEAETLMLGEVPEEDGAKADDLLDLLGDGESTDTVPGVISGEPASSEPTPAADTSATAEVAPAEVAPAEVAPAEVAPAEVAPAEVARAEVPPLDAVMDPPKEEVAAAGVKRAATQTLDMGEDLLPSGDGAPVDEHTAVLASTNPATAGDIKLTADCTSVGREPCNNVVLDDPRVSGEQFRILRVPAGSEGPPWTFEVEDCSRNGTLVNKKILKAAKATLRDQDLIEVLPASKVGQAAAVCFLFHAALAGGPPPAKKPRLSEGSKEELEGAEKAFSEATCAICQEVMHRATSVQPCMHSFCSSCLGGWLKRPGDRLPRCPICRQAVAGVGKNHSLDGMIESLLKAHPDKQRSAAALADLDGRDPLHDSGYDLAKIRGPGDPAAGLLRITVAAAAAAEAMDAESESYHHDSEDSEEEEPGHAWTAPGAVRPPCVNCGLPAWRPLRSAADAILATPMSATAVAKSALANNSVEQEILQEWLHSRGMSLKEAILMLLADPNPEGVPAVVIRPHAPAGGAPVMLPGGVWTELAACNNCSQMILKSAVYSVRERIPNEELPARGQGRGNCWYGRGCRTQSHKRHHAERLNHICEQTRFS
ncbi:unnamed protein product [Effrenium voratum]|nr:unnamed protein product [Effrenium voratum]